MHRSIAFLLATFLLAHAVAPAFAARTGTNGGQRGAIYVTVSNTKGDPASCTVRASARNMAVGEVLYLAHYPLPNADGFTLGTVNAAGMLDQEAVNTVAAAEWDRTHVLLVITDGWVAAVDAEGREAVFSISNNCRS